MVDTDKVDTDKVDTDRAVPPDTIAIPASQSTQQGSLIAGRYRIGSPIGRGGMATVYAAQDQLLGRSVAIKVFRVDVSSPDRCRIDSEMRTLAALRHPGLVTVFDAGACDGIGEDATPYLVMELIAGPSLATLLQRGALAPNDVARFGRQLATSLAYVHANNIVHRDVKPANIMLDADHAHGRYRTKLADFGISRVTGGARFTADGTTVGTANYLSPEQARAVEVGPASDIYSLGLTLIECLTGEAAYPGSGVEAAIARLQYPPSIPAWCDPQWSELLTAMTDSDPSCRPTASDVAARSTPLEHAVAPEATSSPNSVTEPVGFIALQERTPRATAVLPASERSERRRRVTPLRAIAAGLAAVVLVLVISALATGGTSASTAPGTAYPSVSGHLGSDLHQLEGTLP